jgi:polysaccharide export outer membrane protein
MKFEVIPFLLLAGLTAVPVGAQVTPASPVPATAPAVAPNYRIAAGDVLAVDVVNFPNLSMPQAMVGPDGTISLPLIDQVSISGLTRAQVTRLLTNKWRKYVINPAVMVSLIQKHVQTVVLNGYLNHTGTIDYRSEPPLHLLEALAQMGGALPTADASKAVLTHSDGTKMSLDLSHPETKAGTDVDVVLQPGDILYVPQQEGKVSVTGDGIKQPGSIYYKENLTLLDAISASGNINADIADLPGATLTRNGVDKKIDLKALLRDGDPKADILLEPGDIINIPELHNRVYIYGDVLRQGFYNYKSGDRLTDAFATAGLQPDSDTSKINLIRVPQEHKKDKKVAYMSVVNMDKFLRKGDYSGNPEVQPDDSLYIPKRGHTFKLEDVFTPLQAIGSISYATRLLQGH